MTSNRQPATTGFPAVDGFIHAQDHSRWNRAVWPDLQGVGWKSLGWRYSQDPQDSPWFTMTSGFTVIFSMVHHFFPWWSMIHHDLPLDLPWFATINLVIFGVMIHHDWSYHESGVWSVWSLGWSPWVSPGLACPSQNWWKNSRRGAPCCRARGGPRDSSGWWLMVLGSSGSVK